jgi:hypothetical protein
MKRRRQDGLDQPRQRNEQTESSDAAAASSTPSLCETHTIPRLSALQRVGSDALVIILQHLEPRHKLAAISRLSRAFYPLPALAFQLDSINSLLPHAVVRKDGVRTRGLWHLVLPVHQVETRAGALCLPARAAAALCLNCPRFWT